jgi:type IV secretory pathway TrbF-like protein
MIEVENMTREEHTIAPMPYNPDVKQIKVVIPLFCSDSRNVTTDYYKSKEQVLNALEARGTLVKFKKINDPGTFMTQSTINKIKSIILKSEARYSEFVEKGVSVEYDVHVVAHGNVRRKKEYATQKASPDQLEVMNSCTNCGMLHADTVVKALQNFILEVKPTFTIDGREMRVDSEENMRAYMKVHFKGHGTPKDWDGNLLTWLEPIKDLKTHPVEQIRKFEQAIAADHEFSGIAPRIKTFAELLNYETRGFHRVDGKPEQEDLVLRPIFKEERTNGQKADCADVVTPQSQLNPVLVVSGSLHNTRKLIVKHVLPGKETDKIGGKAFSIAGNTFSDERFGPYSAVGFFYALSPTFLNKDPKDQSRPGEGKMVVLGKDKQELVRLLDKIDNDPIVKLIVKHHAKDIHRVVDPRQHFKHLNPNMDRPSPKVKHSRIG